LSDEQFNIEVSIQKVDFSNGDRFEKPASGNEYMLVYLTVRNVGPGTLSNLSSFDFQWKDGLGAVRDSTMVFFTDCKFSMVTLIAGGSAAGCIPFEVSKTGAVEVIYAPYRYEGLVPGRYLSFFLRNS
jgi:hypothetical protein